MGNEHDRHAARTLDGLLQEAVDRDSAFGQGFGDGGDGASYAAAHIRYYSARLLAGGGLRAAGRTPGSAESRPLTSARQADALSFGRLSAALVQWAAAHSVGRTAQHSAAALATSQQCAVDT